jgi:NAD(P)H-hydrate repair Nnr-like enzyme with NAD(P)H-hydrate dehydratase domain
MLYSIIRGFGVLGFWGFGVIGGLAAKNPALLAGAAGVFLVKKTAEALYKRVGTHYSADDLAQKVFEVEHELLTQ